MRRTPTVAAIISTLTAAGLPALASTAPPTDEQVRQTLEHYKQKLDTLIASEEPSRQDIERLRSAAIEDLEISEMTPAQIAMIYQAHALHVDDRRAQALSRLAEFVDDKTINGASAAVLRLELLGNSFGMTINGKRWTYRPTPKVQADLLKNVFAHPCLRPAIRKRNAAVTMLLGALGGLGNAPLWKEHRSDIVALQDIFGPDTPARVFIDAEDYLEVLDQIIDGQDTETVRRVRLKIVQSGQQVLARVETGELEWPRQDVTDLRDVVARLGGAAGRGELVGFEAPTLNFIWSSAGNLHSLGDLQGKVVVLDFWITWCAPCVASFPHVRELQALYADYPVEIVGVTSIQGSVFGADGAIDCKDDPDKELSLMPAYMKQRKITWTVALSKQDVYNPDYGIRGIPHVVIVDPTGIVRHNGLHPADPLQDKAVKINALLEEFDLPAPQFPTQSESDNGSN
ncbi:MAG: TlpA disulfide reductase family protein [Phycisphaerales bacterium]